MVSRCPLACATFGASARNTASTACVLRTLTSLMPLAYETRRIDETANFIFIRGEMARAAPARIKVGAPSRTSARRAPRRRRILF